MICDPYPRLLLARDQVNQGAAVLLMSVEAARRLGVPQEKWVYLRGHADLVEQKLLGCVDVSTSPASIMAVHEALRSQAPGSTTSRRSIYTAAFRSRCSPYATVWAWPPTTCAGSP
jgi:hypothetical protein